MIFHTTFRVEFLVADQTSVLSHFKVALKSKHKRSVHVSIASKTKRLDLELLNLFFFFFKYFSNEYVIKMFTK